MKQHSVRERLDHVGRELPAVVTQGNLNVTSTRNPQKCCSVKRMWFPPKKFSIVLFLILLIPFALSFCPRDVKATCSHPPNQNHQYIKRGTDARDRWVGGIKKVLKRDRKNFNV